MTLPDLERAGNSERVREIPAVIQRDHWDPGRKLDPLFRWDGRIPLDHPPPHIAAQRTAFKRKTLLHATFQTTP
jgi:hypothetical protein